MVQMRHRQFRTAKNHADRDLVWFAWFKTLILSKKWGFFPAW